MEIILTNPKYLWLLLGIPILIGMHIFSLKLIRSRGWIFANYEAIKRVSGEDSIKNSRKLTKNIWLLLVQVFTVCIIALAASDPVYIYTGKTSIQSFVVAIDASSSMLANDFEPNRIEAAKNAAEVFLKSLSQNTRAGIVSFAGTSFVEQGMTDQINDLKSVVRKIEIKRVGGTDIGGAIITSGNLLKGEERSKAIILITDGRSTVGTPVEEGINFAIQNGIVVHAIGMATEQGGTFIRSDIVSKVDEETLKKIAQSTSGLYFLAENNEKLEDAFKNIVTIADEKIQMKLQLPLVLFALAVIFLQWGLINTRYRKLP